MLPDSHDLIHSFLTAEDVAYCIRNSDGEVVEQNLTSQTICGNRKNTPCNRCDTDAIITDSSHPILSGTQLIENKLYQITHIKKHDQSLTLFIVPDHQYQTQIQNFLSHPKLTDKEKDIVKLLLLGLTNTQIQEKLVVSKSTLKTHLNHIYHKVIGLREFREQL